MCGFAGEFLCCPDGRADVQRVRRLALRLRHRGPDEAASYLCPDGRCAIGFHRLAVIDLPGSHQPMTSPDGAVTVAFNGEIYNFRQLRRRLKADGAAFRTAGDTEVLLHLYRRRGQDMVQDLAGMFAFAIYDRPAGRLLLARDRLGEKPLWYAPAADRVLFASEAKALLDEPAAAGGVDWQSLTYYLTIGYIPQPRSAWLRLRKLPPGCVLSVGPEGCGQPRSYWAPTAVELPPSASEAAAVVRDALGRAVEAQMTADVPLGALLSGGVDSSIVVALMARAAGRAGGVRTFTAGFDEAGFDERPHARRVAQHVGTDHVEVLVQPEAAEALDRIVEMYDEPFGDSSALPTWLTCRAAREHVTVALAGDGGDEVFGGYDRYRAVRLAETMPPWQYLLVRLAAGVAAPFAPHDERSRLRRLVRFAAGLGQPAAVQYLSYRNICITPDLRLMVTDSFAESVSLDEPAEWFLELYEAPEAPDELARAQRHDLRTYLPDDLLVKTDIASMAASLELRAPMLDPQVVSTGLSLPPEWKVRGRRGKWLLREAFAEMLPPGHFDRPKQGFGVPLGRWLREDLCQTLRQTLLDESFLGRGIFRREAVASLIEEHVSGRGDHRHRLWALLVLARWLAKWA